MTTTAFTEQQQIDETYIPTEQDWEDVFAEESKFMFNCWNPTERLQVIVTLMATTAQEAVETFTRLNPNLQVINWDLADHMI